MNTEEDVRYYHIRDHRYPELGALTIATTTLDDAAGGGAEVKFGLSYCTPQDQFCRKSGRELALARLNDGEFNDHLILSGVFTAPVKKYWAIQTVLLSFLASSGKIPHWAHGLFYSRIQESAYKLLVS